VAGKWHFPFKHSSNNSEPILEKESEVANQNTSDLLIYDEEHIRYALELESILSGLEEGMHTSDNPREIVLAAMKTACDFYEGDWCGFLEVDLDLNLWAPLIWYNPSLQDRTLDILNDFESAEFFPRWIKCMKENIPLYFPKLDELSDASENELRICKSLYIESLLAIPILPRPCGFLVVRNPKRYTNKSSMLRMLGVVILSNINQYRFLESAKQQLSPDAIKNDKDIIMNLFGHIELFTSRGVLHEEEFNSPKCCRIISYLILNKGTHPPLKIAAALWPEDNSDPDALCSNIRGLLYRFNNKFALISDHRLVESTSAGYRINPELHVMTDLDQFDQCWEAIQSANNSMIRLEMLKQAVRIYRGPVFETAQDEHWLIGLVSHYSIRYGGVVNELLSRLAENNDYTAVGKYASKALNVMPGNMTAHYWLICSLYYSGAPEIAKSEVDRAKADLTDEEYEELISRLRKLKGKTPFSIKIKKSFL